MVPTGSTGGDGSNDTLAQQVADNLAAITAEMTEQDDLETQLQALLLQAAANTTAAQNAATAAANNAAALSTETSNRQQVDTAQQQAIDILNALLPSEAPLPGQEIRASAGGGTVWQYPYGHGFTLKEVDNHLNTINDISVPEALVSTIDTEGYAPGLYELKAVAKCANDTNWSDFIGALFDESVPNKNEEEGEVNSLSFQRFQSPTADGQDPDGLSGTDQRNVMYLIAYVRVTADSAVVYSLRQAPSIFNRPNVVYDVKFTIKRVDN